MDAFWPDYNSEAARNSMNVTIHNLRRMLRFPDSIQVVLFHEGAYQLNPCIEMWIDIEAFELLIQEGRQLESTVKNDESIENSKRRLLYIRVISCLKIPMKIGRLPCEKGCAPSIWIRSTA